MGPIGIPLLLILLEFDHELAAVLGFFHLFDPRLVLVVMLLTFEVNCAFSG